MQQTNETPKNMLTEQLVTDYLSIALQEIEETVFGKKLLQLFPAITVTQEYHAAEYNILKKHGSPACADGDSVYISTEILCAMLNEEFKQWNLASVFCAKSREDEWRMRQTIDKPHYLAQDYGVTVIREIRDIILHELTHNLNEHTKLRRRYAKSSNEYQQKLAIACELQANDGILGENYAGNFTQQLEGVTNKYKHPECIGYHTLREFMEHLKLTPQERALGAMNKAIQQAQASQELAEATGAMQKIDREIEAEKATGEHNVPCNGIGTQQDATSDEKLAGELKKEGLQNVKQLILATLSDKLKYDPTTDSVIYNQVRKRTLHKTYARPSRRGDLELCHNVKIMRKGVKVKRNIEFNKTRDLTILAVDASGSMKGQQQYVSAILDKLLKQVEEIASKEGIVVNYDNLQGLFHTTRASQLIKIKSDEWQQRMRNYRASGGNDFDCVLGRVAEKLRRSATKYETINIINLSDGLGELNADWSATELGEYIGQGRLHWVDAIIANNITQKMLGECIAYDRHHIRTQSIIATEGEEF